MSRPGKAPTSGSPEVLCRRGTQGFGNLPEDRPGLGETPYTTTVSSLCTNGDPLPLYPGRAGVPSNGRGFTSTFRTLPNILCGLRKQAPQSTKSLIRSLILFRISRITLCTYNTTLFTTPDNYNTQITQELFMTILFYIRSLQAPETNWPPRGPPRMLARNITMATARTTVGHDRQVYVS